jgi:hypothetical protein
VIHTAFVEQIAGNEEVRESQEEMSHQQLSRQSI